MRHSRVTGVATLALVAGALAVSGAPAGAHPPAPVDEAGHPVRGQLHTWMHRSEVPFVHGRVEIRRVACPMGLSFAGCVFTARPRVLYLRPHLHQTRRVFLHELGHVFDLVVLNARERRRFKRILGIRRSGWFYGGLPPAEWFADGYAACAMRLRLRRAFSPTPYGYSPSPRRHARVCRLIVTAARPGGRPPQRPKNPPRVVEVKPPPPQETQQPGEGCNLLDQLLSGCEPPPAPPPPLPV